LQNSKPFDVIDR